MRQKIREHKQWAILLLAFLICCLVGIIFAIIMFTPSLHDYSVTEQTEEEQTEDEKIGTYYVYGGAHGLPVCDAPSDYAKMITVLSNKTEVDILSSEKRGYYKIQYGKKEGYVKSDYLLDYDETASDELKDQLMEDYPLYYVIASEDIVNMYKKKDDTSEVLAEIPVGYRVRILGQASDGYFRVAYRNKVGYILSENLAQYEQ